MKRKEQKITGIASNIMMTQNLRDALPEVLTNYLINLVQIGQAQADSRHVFRLSKNKLSGKELQDIVHTGESKVPALHRVFGFNPINAEIIVTSDGAGHYMVMACNE